MNKNLYLIIPFFSFNNFSIREKNLKTTLSFLSIYTDLKIIIVEGYIKGYKTLSLSEFKNIEHIQYELISPIWVKENLINLGINSLPENWEYAAWLDADIIFLNINWVQETIQKLENSDVVQLFNFIEYLDENGNILLNNKLDYHNKPILPGVVYLNKQTTNFYYAPTGFGWGFKKSFYKKINKFFEYNIVGTGDLMFALCCLGIFNTDNFRKSPSLNYTELAMNYYKNFKDVKLDCVNGMICHLWHGDLLNRQYEKRWDILLKNNFDPSKDIHKDNNGIIYLNNNPQLEMDIKNYFIERAD